jgi:hypothetical protein
MRLILFVLLIVISFGCKKQTQIEDCGCNSKEKERVENLFGIVVETDDGFEIFSDEKGLLLPCSELPEEFKKEGQPVTVSGILKAPCKSIPDKFEITPIQINALKLRALVYNKTDITLEIIKSEDHGLKPGFGYFIEDLRRPYGTRILQPHLPAVPGLDPFCTPEDAMKTGLSVIYGLRVNEDGYVSPELLEYLKVNKKCNQSDF